MQTERSKIAQFLIKYRARNGMPERQIGVVRRTRSGLRGVAGWNWMPERFPTFMKGKLVVQ
jgi:hypothetical protein